MYDVLIKLITFAVTISEFNFHGDSYVFGLQIVIWASDDILGNVLTFISMS